MPPKTQTFGEHVSELRRRLFYVLFVVIIAGSLGWVFNNALFHFIEKPLGQQLYYTSPIGGFNAMIKISMLLGLIAGIPVLVYQICHFVAPAFKSHKPAQHLRLLLISILLAATGVAFGYYVSLPASLRFLTHVGGGNFQPLLVVNDYLNFVFSYLLGFALLFQLPLFINFINGRSGPLKIGALMRFQRWVILLSFIVAAILTPTPDPINQTIMAAPVILLYQFSIGLVWIQNRKIKNRAASTEATVPSAVQTETWEQPVRKAAIPSVVSSAISPRSVFIMDIVPPAKSS